MASATPSKDASAVSSTAASAAGGGGGGGGAISAATAASATATDSAKAEEYKKAGNGFFVKKQYEEALEQYSRAIASDACIPAFYANRAFCFIKLEKFGAAVVDATTALELNPRYSKAYYRRACALMALFKYAAALKDLAKLLKLVPTDKPAKAMLAACRKIVREKKFAAAIKSERSTPRSETIRIDTMTLSPMYDGPRLPDLWLKEKPEMAADAGTASAAAVGGDQRSGGEVAAAAPNIDVEFLTKLMEYFRDGKQLPKVYVVAILLRSILIFRSLPSLVDIDIPESTQLNVFGDVHGQFYDVLNIFKIAGMPSATNAFLFNGDFVDRGSWSLEVILLFCCMKLVFPSTFHMCRGNHETKNMNMMYGFRGEVMKKGCDEAVMELFSELFNWLPLGHVIKKKVLVVHGGLFSEDGVKLDDIRQVNRNREPPDSGIMCEILWTDPQAANGRAPSKRGVSLDFGPDVAHAFLDDNNLDILIRSHEVKAEGYEEMADGRVITVFSAPNYCDSMGNKGAFIRFDPDMNRTVTKFTAVPHPPIRPMAYANPAFGM